MYPQNLYVRIGEGGVCSRHGPSGLVYLAHDTLTGTSVAIKRQVVPREEASRELSVYRLLASCPRPPVLRLWDETMIEEG